MKAEGNRKIEVIGRKRCRPSWGGRREVAIVAHVLYGLPEATIIKLK